MSVTYATNRLSGIVIWLSIWEPTQERGHTHVTRVKSHLYRVGIWRNIWRPTLKTNHLSVNNVTNHFILVLIWNSTHGPIWGHTSVTCVARHFLRGLFCLNILLNHAGETSFKRKICHKEFSRRRYLNIHVKIHNRAHLYTCQLCNKSFTAGIYLERHSRTNSGEKPYSCTLCHRTFSFNSHLIVHTRTHTGERPNGQQSKRLHPEVELRGNSRNEYNVFLFGIPYMKIQLSFHEASLSSLVLLNINALHGKSMSFK